MTYRSRNLTTPALWTSVNRNGIDELSRIGLRSYRTTIPGSTNSVTAPLLGQARAAGYPPSSAGKRCVTTWIVFQSERDAVHHTTHLVHASPGPPPGNDG